MNSAVQPVKARDIAPTGVRLPPALRDELVRQSTINGRSLSQEITVRLTASLREPGAAAHIAPTSGTRGELTNALTLGSKEHEEQYGRALSEVHRQLNALFDALTPDKQLALLTLLKR